MPTLPRPLLRTECATQPGVSVLALHKKLRFGLAFDPPPAPLEKLKNPVLLTTVLDSSAAADVPLMRRGVITMAVTIQLPADIESELRKSFGPDLDRAALEALVLEGYRSQRFGIGQVRRILGFESRFDAEAWLGAHGVRWNYGLADLEADRATLQNVLPDAS
jgi:hypothetical protein